jgi:hypothetical protein
MIPSRLLVAAVLVNRRVYVYTIGADQRCKCNGVTQREIGEMERLGPDRMSESVTRGDQIRRNAIPLDFSLFLVALS